MLFFTDTGKCYWLKVHQIPQASRTSQGRAIVNLIGCETEDRVQAFVSVKEFKDNNYNSICIYLEYQTSDYISLDEKKYSVYFNPSFNYKGKIILSP